MRLRSLPILALLACLGIADGRDATKFNPRPSDWPQWQGPDRNAISREKGLLQEWSKDGPKLAWKATGLGQNYCTPTVAGGRIFLMGNVDGKEHVIALNETDGKP